jgi:hypothetical protein
MLFIYVFYGYFITGITIAIWFCFFKVTKTDAAAAGSSLLFKLIIVPGAMLLWPFVLYKLSSAKNYTE